MKVIKRTAQALASIAVLSLLLSGSVFAYSTRLSHISSFSAPSPLDDKSSTRTTEDEHTSTTTSTATSSTTTEHEHDSSTTTSTATSSTTTEHDDKTSTSTTTEHEDKSSTTTTGHEDESSSTTKEHDNSVVNAKEEGMTDEEEINKAKDSKQIPAVVEVSGSGSTITQIDSKFSVSVSRPSDNSLSVSIAGANGTGPRVLLIDISKDAGALSSLGSLKVTYDGETASQASSLSQVLSGTSTSPPSYIVLLTSSGAHLLVFIPHFSSHLIELLAGFVPFGALTALTAGAPLMLGGLAVIVAISAVRYAARKRFVTSESR